MKKAHIKALEEMYAEATQKASDCDKAFNKAYDKLMIAQGKVKGSELNLTRENRDAIAAAGYSFSVAEEELHIANNKIDHIRALLPEKEAKV